MAKGPAPKPADQRVRRNIDPIPTTILETDGNTYGPELPQEYDWHRRTHTWWQTWRTSPNAQTFTATDWDFLLDTAVLHTQFWNGENVAAELRLRVAKFGASPEDRLRLRLQIGTPTDTPKVESKSLTSNRKLRLIKLVGDNDGKEAKAN